MNHINTILLVEDDLIDREVASRLFAQNDLSAHLQFADDGLDAITKLKALQQAEPKPALILLDINMPRMNGLEFLAKLRQDEILKDISVIMLTSSDQECDLEQTKKLDVTHYFIKPIRQSHIPTIIRFIEQYDA